MLTHFEINARFLALDRHPVLLDAVLDGWWAWPIVKERLWLLCLNSSASSQGSARPRNGLVRLSAGIVQLATTFLMAGHATTAVFYEPRTVALAGGRHVHPHLGDLQILERAEPWLHYRYAWGRGRSWPMEGRLLEDAYIGAIAAALAAVVRSFPGIRRLTSRLADAIAPSFPEVPRDAIVAAIQDQLGRFTVRFVLMRALLKRWKVRRIVVLDPDGKVPEVAAAKSLGLVVTEVQHGMFSSREPDYSWSTVHRALPHRLPLPDRVVVFGPLWSSELLKGGFWHADEIVEARDPVLHEYRVARQNRPPRKTEAPLRLLFASQHYVHDAAISFFDAVFRAQAAAGRRDFYLRIKVHPLERHDRAEYEAFAAQFPGQCSVAADESEAFAEMSDADGVVAYTSLMLLEAVGIGIPAIGLRGGRAREGFCSTFGVPQLAGAIPEFEDPAAFAEIASWRDPVRYAARQNAIRTAAMAVYSFDGPRVEDVLTQ